MAEFKFSDLKSTYESFREPKTTIFIDGKELGKDQGIGVSGMEVELTAGYEASIATVTLVGGYDTSSKSFDINKIKQYLYLGSTIEIYLGYAVSLREVFRGFIAKVHFIVPEIGSEDMPSIELTCMDVKGLMMANRHSKRLKSECYSDAVKEILDVYPIFKQKDSSSGDFMVMNISDTPDKSSGGGNDKTTDKRVEMVEESDYDFIVKAAKRYNFEFFIVGKTLYFIEAKKNTTSLIELVPNSGMRSIDVGYDMTGLVKEVVVRNIDNTQGKYIGTSKQSQNKISLGNKAKQLIEKQSLVYIDPTTDSKEEAGYRADYLLETAGYRLGSVNGEIVGMPEIVPGRFLTLTGFGSPVDNDFYLTNVRHILRSGDYRTVFEGCANSIKS